jgi:thymidylate synthase (FAD)
MIRRYEKAIDDGICPEQARFMLPQGCEVNWVWTGSLFAFANFYNQRSDSHAQKEIQELAEQVGEIIEPLFPVAWPALTRGEY